ncbi:ribosome biogenesis GTPase Der [Candidatus Spongiihabitans sp.]|uniref:ribosome biogenesis GTPase Der n=1 Tax=Candidatus Spongiihabitans sp. TaxID=3101308 RepID=UPI003C6EB67E
MLPVLALVGRPNVGKSTLFNKLTRSRDALVDDQPGVTRDRLYGPGRIGNKPYLVVDTGGIEGEGDEGDFTSLVKQQVDQVIEEAEIVLFLVDASEGMVHQDKEIAMQLRQSGTEICLLVNKTEGVASSLATSEFQELALGNPIAISAKRGDGVERLITQVMKVMKNHAEIEDEYAKHTPKIAIVGRPNVGKSTLINKLVGEHRVIVSDIPGTTRDSVHIPLVVDHNKYVLIDTAGVRKKSKVDEVIEKFSVIKTLQAIETCHVVLLVVDASTEIGTQDAAIAGMVSDFGRSIVIVVNKWDGLSIRQRNKIKQEIKNKLSFLPYPEMIYISALHGSNIIEIMPAARRAYDSAMISIATSSLNRTLENALIQTPPPMHNQRSVRLKFTHQAGKNPPVIVIHGNLVNTIPVSYQKYLSKFFAKAYHLVGTPVRIIPRVSENPFRSRSFKSGSLKSGNPAHIVFKKRSGRRRKL